jgi:multidrug efflux pump subunit AcrA (membrane-fusion protein)
LDRVLVRVDVPESAIPFVKTGDPARVLVEAVSDEFTGRIKHVIPQADVSARTFPVQIELPNPDGRLKGGMIAWATATSGPAAEVVAVPKDAVDVRQGVSYVCTVTTTDKISTATPMPVTTGADIDEWIAITSGNVAPETLVITRGNERVLFPGPVEISNPESLP